MTLRIACNLVLDCCGILILWLFLLPLFIRKETVVFSRRKMNWLLYSAITHFCWLRMRSRRLKSAGFWQE